MKPVNGIALLLLSLVTCQSALGQGALTPPGAPAPTMKTLDQIAPGTIVTNVPYTITAPGRYCLATNLVAGVGVNGITIAADGVTLDLNGFELRGTFDSQTAISVSGSRYNLTIRDGSIRGWDAGGIQAGTARNALVENLHVAQNAEHGITLGSNAIVRACVAEGNTVGAVGIAVGPGSVVQDSVARGNNSAGIQTGVGSVVRDCVATKNATGIVVGNDCSVQRCVATGNASNGIHAGDDSLVTACVANENAQTGIAGGWTVMVLDSLTNTNAVHGIDVGTDSTVRGSVACWNGQAGIRVDSRCTIDGNKAIHNGIGFQLTSDRNLFVRNYARVNATNFNFSGVQTYGRTNAIVGEISADPWSNFTN